MLTSPGDGNRLQLSPKEAFWRDQYNWLKSIGYTLRNRYDPQFIPAWPVDDEKWEKDAKEPRWEEQVRPKENMLLDAKHSDGFVVMLKRMELNSLNKSEFEIIQKLNLAPLSSDPHNRCIPLLEILEIPHRPSEAILVMPWLAAVERYEWTTTGEVTDFCIQVLEGLSFLHNHSIAHGDCGPRSILIDARPIDLVQPHPYQDGRSYYWKKLPKPRSRTKRPVHYYWTNFNHTRYWDPENREKPEAQSCPNRTLAPEYRRNLTCNPFQIDIYCTGKMLYELTSKYVGLEFLSPVFAKMMDEYPEERPFIDQSLAELRRTVRRQSRITLCRRIRPKGAEEPRNKKMKLRSAHLAQQICNLLFLRDSVPRPGPMPKRKKWARRRMDLAHPEACVRYTWEITFYE